LDENQNMAEAAFSVSDQLQHKGIGTYMARLINRLARERGIRGFTASMLSENVPMRRVFQTLAVENGSSLHATYEDGVTNIWFHFGERTEPAQAGQDLRSPGL
jgi:hypothetical protein